MPTEPQTSRRMKRKVEAPGAFLILWSSFTFGLIIFFLITWKLS